MSDDPHAISLSDAIALTTRWRDNHPASIKAGQFARVAFDRLLRQSECAGIRIYLGEKSDGAWTFVMVGTNAAGKDLVHVAPAGGPGDPPPPCPPIEEEMETCPPFCDCDSPLNGECL